MWVCVGVCGCGRTCAARPRCRPACPLLPTPPCPAPRRPARRPSRVQRVDPHHLCPRARRGLPHHDARPPAGPHTRGAGGAGGGGGGARLPLHLRHGRPQGGGGMHAWGIPRYPKAGPGWGALGCAGASSGAAARLAGETWPRPGRRRRLAAATPRRAPLLHPRSRLRRAGRHAAGHAPGGKLRDERAGHHHVCARAAAPRLGAEDV